MTLKIRLFLLLTVLGIALYHVQGNKMCDWPRGTCTYYKDPCPPNWHHCPQYDYDCPVRTNHCCCRNNPPRPTPKPKPKPKPKVCDWPRGTCTYIKDPCPPDWERCPQYDVGCKLATNHCCCLKNPPKSNVKDVPKVEILDKPCDWPNGTCTDTGDSCLLHWVRCPKLDDGCDPPKNHCCCRTTPPPPPGQCDWPNGTCTYVGDPCPPGWKNCPDYDMDCRLSLNRCCCRS